MMGGQSMSIMAYFEYLLFSLFYEKKFKIVLINLFLFFFAVLQLAQRRGKLRSRIKGDIAYD